MLLPVQVIMIAFISPPFWSRLLKPGTKRAERLRFCMRAAINALAPLL